MGGREGGKKSFERSISQRSMDDGHGAQGRKWDPKNRVAI